VAHTTDLLIRCFTTAGDVGGIFNDIILPRNACTPVLTAQQPAVDGRLTSYGPQTAHLDCTLRDPAALTNAVRTINFKVETANTKTGTFDNPWLSVVCPSTWNTGFYLTGYQFNITLNEVVKGEPQPACSVKVYVSDTALTQNQTFTQEIRISLAPSPYVWMPSLVFVVLVVLALVL